MRSSNGIQAVRVGVDGNWPLDQAECAIPEVAADARRIKLTCSSFISMKSMGGSWSFWDFHRIIIASLPCKPRRKSSDRRIPPLIRAILGLHRYVPGANPKRSIGIRPFERCSNAVICRNMQHPCGTFSLAGHTGTSTYTTALQPCNVTPALPAPLRDRAQQWLPYFSPSR